MIGDFKINVTLGFLYLYVIINMKNTKEVLYKDGDKYNGEVTTDGKLEGEGVYTFKNGSSYKGAFRNGQFNGKGELFDKTNNLTIICSFANGKAEGKDGKIKYSDGSSYSGGIKDNMREGEGKYTFPK